MFGLSFNTILHTPCSIWKAFEGLWTLSSIVGNDFLYFENYVKLKKKKLVHVFISVFEKISSQNSEHSLWRICSVKVPVMTTTEDSKKHHLRWYMKSTTWHTITCKKVVLKLCMFLWHIEREIGFLNQVEKLYMFLIRPYMKIYTFFQIWVCQRYFVLL